MVAAIAGDVEAADRVELDLPETGVCGIGVADAMGAESSCCGDVPAPAIAAAAATATTSGCGTPSCGTKSVVPVVAAATAARCGG